MRIWSLHPRYLDSKGLVALWRETLLAKNVLAGNTKGYKNHPQLQRFKSVDNSLACINQYLADVYTEAQQRRYNFNKSKINWDFKSTQLPVTSGQIAYERQHLLNKLAIRDPEKHTALQAISSVEPHPLFVIVDGKIADWEILE